MAFLALKSPLSTAERAERRRLMISDALSLTVLFGITALLAIVTNIFYKSYAAHQAELAHRWIARGELALRQGKDDAAVDALRSALAYAPGDRNVEIELAEALAASGRIQEAASYFNTLWESEPGSGIINLELARLAVRQGNVGQALESYQRAIYGTWEANGSTRRRATRIELIQFLLSRRLYNQARSELLAAAGNAPEADSGAELTIARLMETAGDPANALRLYRAVLLRQPSSPPALEGAARTAYSLGRALEARQYLLRALNASQEDRQASRARTEDSELLRDSIRLLELYPSSQLGTRARSERILRDRQIAQVRFSACVQSRDAELAVTGTLSRQPPGSQAGPLASGPLASLASHFKRHAATPAESTLLPGAPSDPLGPLADRWKQQPAEITLSALERDPDLAQTEIQLIYDTEEITEQVCGSPTGDDALLLKIAQAPEAVEQK